MFCFKKTENSTFGKQANVLDTCDLMRESQLCPGGLLTWLRRWEVFYEGGQVPVALYVFCSLSRAVGMK